MSTGENDRWPTAGRIAAVVVILATVGALAGGVAAGSTATAVSANASDGPAVETAWADALGDTDYLVAANLTSLGGAEEATVRVEYRVAGTSQWSRTANRTVNRTGGVRFELRSLAADTTYEYRAVATTVDGRDAGAIRNFTTRGNPPVVETRPAANVGQNAVELRGELLDLGGADTANVSFYWRAVEGIDYDFTAEQTLTAPGNFSETVWLEPNTTYEYRAGVSNGNGEWASGDFRTVTTDPAFDLDTREATNVTATSATLNGVVAEFGDAASANVSFEYRKPGTGLIGWTDVDATLASDGSFAGSVDGLEPDTTYEFRAVGRATDGDVDTAESVTFTTDDADPVVTTGEATTINETTATLSGTVTDFGGADGVKPAIEYRKQGATTWSTAGARLASDGSFTASVSGLRADTGYEFRAVATASDGDRATGQTRTFRTEAFPAVETGTATDVNASAATLTATVTDLGGAADGTVRFEYRPTDGTTWTETDGQSVTETGTVETTVTGLAGDTSYEFRAVLDADGDRVIGDATSFATDAESRPPAVASLSIRDTSGPNPHVNLAIDWRVTDADADLATVRVTVRGDAGQIVADTRSVSGSSATGALQERVKHGGGTDYTVTVTVTDAAGTTATATDTLAATRSKQKKGGR